MGIAGAGSLAQIVNAAIANQERFDRMREFFSGVGSDDKAGIWEDVPAAHDQFRQKYRARMDRQQKKAASVEAPV